MDKHTSSERCLLRLLERIVRNPHNENRPFILGGTQYGDLYLQQNAIKNRFVHGYESENTLILATQDRASIAASVLSALAGGPKLIIPHALSQNVLEDLRELWGVTSILADQPGMLTESLVQPTSSPAEGTHPPFSLLRDVDETFAWLFTGGSTGQPRMWGKTPRNLIGEAAHLASKYDIDSHDIILAAVGPQHIYGLLFSVLLPLVTGASVVNEMPRFHGEIEEALITHGVTVFVGAPAHYRAQRGKKIPSQSLRMAFCSGGFLPKEDSLWFSAETAIGVTEVYGSTETGGVASRCRAEGESSWMPFECVQWKIDRERLCIKSPFLSPDLTRDKDGYFTTGDRVAPGEGKTFDLRGRTDKVVKVAGRRVELDEVESRIRRLSFVRDAYVFAFSSGTIRSTEIVCLVVPEGNACDRALRESLQSVLEPSAMPRRVRWVKQIPLTSAGKPDRQAAERLFTDEKPATKT